MVNFSSKQKHLCCKKWHGQETLLQQPKGLIWECGQDLYCHAQYIYTGVDIKVSWKQFLQDNLNLMSKDWLVTWPPLWQLQLQDKKGD